MSTRARRWRAWSVGGVLTLALVLCAGAGCRRGRDGDADSGNTGVTVAPGAPSSPTWIADDVGVVRGVAVVARPDRSEQRVFLRDDGPDEPSSAGTLVSVVTLLAALRAGVVNENTRHNCNGYSCSRAHGDLGAADALALGCNNFFEDVAGRLGSGALGAGFAAFGLEPPPVPEDPEARVRLATRSQGWTVTPRTLLAMAQTMARRPAPWPGVLDEGLVPRAGDPGPLRGVASDEELLGWFVGYGSGASDWLVVSRVWNCPNACGALALRLARWAVERVHPSAVRPSDAGAGAGSRGRRGARSR